MAAKGSTFDNDLLLLIFNGIPIGNIADNAGTGPLTDLYVSLHTSSPGPGGNQTTNEATYLSYQRVPVSRDSGGWTVVGSVVSPVATIVFDAATSGSEVATHFAVGTDPSGAGKLLYYGSIAPTISISTGVTPELTTASTITES